MSVHGRGRVPVAIGISIMSLEIFQDAFYLPAPLTTLYPEMPSHRATLYPPLQLTQIWPLFRCSYSPPRPSTQHMVSNLLFLQHISFELLLCSMHWARSMRTRRERELLQGVLIVDKMNSYQNGVTVVTKKSLGGHLIHSWMGRWAPGKLLPWHDGQEPDPP